MEKIKNALGWAILPATVIYLELLLRATAGLQVFHDGLPGSLATGLAAAFLAAALSALPRSEKAARWICFLPMEIVTVWFAVAFFMNDSYKVFMSPEIIASEAKNVVANYGGNVLNVLTRGLPLILLYHVPVILFVIFRRRLTLAGSAHLRRSALCLGLAVLCFFGGRGLNIRSEVLRNQYENEYTYDNAVRNFGLLSALDQELRHSVSQEREVPTFTTLEQAETAAPTPARETPAPVADSAEEAEEEPPVEYGLSVMDIDFDSAGGGANIAAMNSYVQTLTPSSKNEYTGLFAGKNLILIAAEAFSRELIDEERTPALYRLATKGIVFEDFYQPAWGGSTSTGEYSFLMGIAPTKSSALLMTQGRNLYFTMGNQLQRLGYFSRAYHDGWFTYYSRHLTHENLGYSLYYGIGNGLEEGLTLGMTPSSDKEMFEYTAAQYIDQQPFSVYYMTISGHATYAFVPSINAMSAKNKAFTEGMEGSDTLLAYIACSQELEYGLESLLEQLEEAGIADDTVIALVADHYPYGLLSSMAWGNYSNALAELYGYNPVTNPERDHSAGILWCGCLEDLDEPIVVSSPSSSLDMLPTLSNLFGLEWDSRMLVGRDVFSDAEALVFWNDYCWLTEEGYYDSHARTFTPNEGAEVDQDYIDRHIATVRDKLTYSSGVVFNDYFGLLFGPDNVT